MQLLNCTPQASPIQNPELHSPPHCHFSPEWSPVSQTVPPRKVNLCFLTSLIPYPHLQPPDGWFYTWYLSAHPPSLCSPFELDSCCLPTVFHWFLYSPACFQYCTPILMTSIYLPDYSQSTSSIKAKLAFTSCLCVPGTLLETWYTLYIILTAYTVIPTCHQRKLSPTGDDIPAPEH